jgi:hypothetical protein
MVVLLAVTIDAEGRGVFKEKRLMAAGAANRLMFSEERRPALLMIEFLNLFPGFLNMAATTGLAQLPLMLIVSPMAAAAFG